MNVEAIAFLAISTIYWVLVLRYYYNLSKELSQYAQKPLKSPKARTAIITIYVFGLTLSFAFINLNSEVALLSALRGSAPTLAFFTILLSFLSPMINYLSVYTQATNSLNTIFSSSFLLAVASGIAILTPFGYVLYKTRKEIEMRFQMATGGMLEKLHGDFKMYRTSHGKPVARGIFGALMGLIMFPWYLYFDLFKAKQGLVVYRKVTTTKYDWTFVDPSHPPPFYVRDERLKVDFGEALAKVDKRSMNNAGIPICPKCKRALIYLEDYQKWWCAKCKKAYIEK